MTTLAPEAETTRTSVPLKHAYCYACTEPFDSADLAVSMCGHGRKLKASLMPGLPPDNACAVCVDLASLPCGRCGS